MSTIIISLHHLLVLFPANPMRTTINGRVNTFCIFVRLSVLFINSVFRAVLYYPVFFNSSSFICISISFIIRDRIFKHDYEYSHIDQWISTIYFFTHKYTYFHINQRYIFFKSIYLLKHPYRHTALWTCQSSCLRWKVVLEIV